MKKFMLIMVGLAMLVTANTSYAISQGAAQSLTIPPGARANALGQSYAAIVEDATAIWWNPAGLAQLKANHLVTFQHAKLVPGLADDVFYEYLAYSKYMEELKGSFGFSIIYVTYGETSATDQNSVEVGTFTPYEIIPTLAYGTNLTEDLSLGIGVKFIHVSLVPEYILFRLNYITGGNEHAGEGQSFALDLGVLKHNLFIPNFNLGFSITNFGPDMVYIDKSKSDPIPLTARLGLSYNMEFEGDQKLLFTMDANKMLIYTEKEDYSKRDPYYQAIITSFMDDDSAAEEWEQVVLNFGAEYAISNFYFRAGYISDREGQIMDPTFGFGLHYRNYAFDYAAIPQYKELPYVNKFSITASF